MSEYLIAPDREESELPPEDHPLRQLGLRLGELLDEDHWAECERLLLKGWASVAKDREVLEEAAEAAEILDNLIDSVRKHGNYSKDATLLFLSHARQCLNGLPHNAKLSGRHEAQRSDGRA